MLDDYKFLHQIPEAGFKEFRTQEYLLTKLKKLNCFIKEIEPTGIIAYFNQNETKTIAFRAEMDGLPIQEQTNLSFKSNNGFMHACAHDAHMSILLNLCEYIANNHFKVNVVAIFQPSEESYGGSLKIIEDSFFKSLNVSEVYAIHLWPNLPRGQLFTKEFLFPSATEIDIEIIGKESHLDGNGVNAIEVASTLLNKIKVSLEERFNCGKLIAEGKRNIKCLKARLECTYRTYQNPQLFLSSLEDIFQELEFLYSCQITYSFRTIPFLKNDLKLIQNVQVSNSTKTFFQAEDFAFYSQSYKVLFLLLGCGETADLHSANFNFDLSLLKVGYESLKNILNSFI